MPGFLRIGSLCIFGVAALLLCMSESADGQAKKKKGPPAKKTQPQPLTPAQAKKLAELLQAQADADKKLVLALQKKYAQQLKNAQLAAGAKAKGKTGPNPPGNPLHAQQSAALRYAYVLLEAANHGAYNGNRSRAVIQVAHALGIVDPKGVSTANSEVVALNQLPWRKIMRLRGSAEFDPLSNAQILSAQRLIVRAADMADPKTQVPYFKHLNAASADALAALQFNNAVSAQVSEVQMVTQAYVLVSATNNLYRSHRAAAKTQLQIALDQLNGIPLITGSVQQKINTITAANRKTIADLKDAGLISAENQRVSNYQMLMADTLIQQALANLNGIGGPLRNLENAHGEIVAALLNL